MTIQNNKIIPTILTLRNVLIEENFFDFRGLKILQQ